MLRLAASLLLALPVLAASGCASVKPWERDVLARSDMAWEPDPLEAKRNTHIHYSKEASLPGGGAGGGGCGCN
ncbi:MAG TPA: DUF4266 domain-containing protein [Myxococcota bacterium]|jgi:hypothetical protein